jgi:hypothetical protein
MKLELKYLDFVNNGIVKLSRQPHWVFDNVKLQYCQLSFSSTINEPYLRYRDVTFGMHQIIPYKRPLSDLTKEIEVNGEKFVPMERLEIDSSDVWINDVNNQVMISQKHCHSIYAIDVYYNIIQELLEWHFDVFGLIGAGLAIDINTLNK